MARWWSTSYVEAKAAGHKYYRSDRPCKRGHVADRFVSTLQCTECHKERAASLDVEQERTRKRLLMRRRRLNPEVREKERQYQKDHAVETNLKTARRYARRRAAFVENVPLAYLMERDKGCCRLCGDPLSMSTKFPHPKTPTEDHIVPLSKGGTHERSNLQLACFACNRQKGDRSKGEQLLLVG